MGPVPGRADRTIAAAPLRLQFFRSTFPAGFRHELYYFTVVVGNYAFTSPRSSFGDSRYRALDVYQYARLKLGKFIQNSFTFTKTCALRPRSSAPDRLECRGSGFYSDFVNPLPTAGTWRPSSRGYRRRRARILDGVGPGDDRAACFSIRMDNVTFTAGEVENPAASSEGC